MLKIRQIQSWRQICVRQSIGQLRVNRASFRLLHATASLAAVKPFLLADIGEGRDLHEIGYIYLTNRSSGIKEVQIIQW